MKLSLVSFMGLAQIPKLIYEYEFADSFNSLDSVIGPSSVDLNPFAVSDTQFTFTVKGYMQMYRFDIIKKGMKSRGILTAYVYRITDDEIKWTERKTANGARVIRKRRWELQINKTLLGKSFCDSLWAHVLALNIDSLPTKRDVEKEIGYSQGGGIHFECELVRGVVRKHYETSQSYIDSCKALSALQPIRHLVLDFLDSNPSVNVVYRPNAYYNDRWSYMYISTGTIEQEVYGPLGIDVEWSGSFFGY